MRIDEIKNAVLPACREFGVRRLDAFGSLARDEGTPSRDIDLLVEFGDPGRNPAKRFFGFLHFLEDTLGCDVDFLTIDSLRNPYFSFFHAGSGFLTMVVQFKRYYPVGAHHEH